MSAYAMSGLTPQHYAEMVRQNLDRYLSDPAYYEQALRPPGSAADAVSHVVFDTTNLPFTALTWCAALMMVVVTRRSFDLQVTSLLLKLSGAAFLIQPFVHVCSARYWQSFAPVYGLSAALLIQIAAPMVTPLLGRGRTGGATSEPVGTSTSRVTTRTLTAAQAALAVLFVVVMVGLVVVAGS
jgi:anaerobic selenocysteine-containing dehydrogenase